jgi:hypothetical protein
MEKFFASLDTCKVLIYRRPNFLSEDFEYEQYVGQIVLRNLFQESPSIITSVTKMSLIFPERWINCVECHELFPRLQKFYPNLKELFIKTHEPLIITNVPREYASLLDSENEIVSKTGSNKKCNDSITSLDDSVALFPGISSGTCFTL